jgi:hypothetical protein
MVTWIPSICPLYVTIYTSTMDPMGMYKDVSLKVDKKLIRSDHDGGDHDDDTDHGEVLSLSS